MGIPQPSKIHKLKGSYEKNPQRENKREPIPRGEVGAPPDTLSAEAQEAWHEVLRYAPPGVIYDSDRLALEVMANLIVDIRDPALEWRADRHARLHALLVQFGLTPAARSKIVATSKVSEDDPWSKL